MRNGMQKKKRKKKKKKKKEGKKNRDTVDAYVNVFHYARWL